MLLSVNLKNSLTDFAKSFLLGMLLLGEGSYEGKNKYEQKNPSSLVSNKSQIEFMFHLP